MGDTSLLTKLNEDYFSFTPAERRVADYITAHRGETQYMSISELAKECKVAVSTVSRFCRKLGLISFHDLKLTLAATTAERGDPVELLSGEVLPTDSVEEMCRKVRSAHLEAIDETMTLIRPETIRAAAELIIRAPRVLCMGQGGSAVMAQEAAHLFSTVRDNFTYVLDSHMQAIAISALKRDDVILYFSYSGATRELMDMLSVREETGAKLILITRFPRSPGGLGADVVLQCGSKESPIQLGSVSARMAQLYLLDVLCSEVCRRDLPAAAHRREQVARALEGMHL